MAISYVGGVEGGRAGSTSTTTQSLSGTLTGGSNTSPSAGDLVVVFCASAGDGTGSPTSQTISGNNNGAYTTQTFQSITTVTYDSFSQVNYKIQGGTVDTSLTIPSSGNARNAQRWIVHVFRNVDSTTPLDVTSTYATGTATGRPNPASIAPSTAGAWICAFYASAAATGTAYTAPTDFATDWLGNTTVDTADVMTGGGYYTGWTSGSYDPAAITAGGTTGANDSWTATTIALRPYVPITLDQTAFRFYEDGTESGSTAIDTQNTNITRDVSAGDSNLQLRIRLQNSGDAGLSTDDFQLIYDRNSGATVDQVGASSLNVQVYASANLTEGESTTNRLGSGSGSFVAGKVTEDGTVDNLSVTANNYTELLFSLKLIKNDLTNNDTLDFKVSHNGNEITYTTVPRITVVKTNNYSGTPTTTSLTLATFAPTVVASDHKTATPTTASLTLSSFAPNVIIGTVVTPTTTSLTLTTFEPTVSISDNQSVTPATASLITTTFAPTVTATNNQFVTPSTASLTTSLFAPTVSISDNQFVEPSTASLTLATFAPTVSVSSGTTVTPDTASLTTTLYAPDVTVSNNQFVEPSTASLITSLFAPTVTITDNKYVTPDTASLVLTTFAPSVSVGFGTDITPITASLTLTTHAPTVTITDNKFVTPETVPLTLTTHLPTIAITENQFVTPQTASLNITTYAPSVVVVSNGVQVTPNTAILTLETFAPTVSILRAHGGGIIDLDITKPNTVIINASKPTHDVNGTSDAISTLDGSKNLYNLTGEKNARREV